MRKQCGQIGKAASLHLLESTASAPSVSAADQVWPGLKVVLNETVPRNT